MIRPRTPTQAYALLAVIVVSTPLALAVETGMRLLLFPPEFEDVRMWLRPELTTATWWLVPLSALAGVVSLPIHRRIVARNLRRMNAEGRPAQPAREEFDAFMLSSSIPQIPALIGTFAFTFGSHLLPVAIAMAVATVGVTAHVRTIRRLVGLFDEPPDQRSA